MILFNALLELDSEAIVQDLEGFSMDPGSILGSSPRTGRCISGFKTHLSASEVWSYEPAIVFPGIDPGSILQHAGHMDPGSPLRLSGDTTPSSVFPSLGLTRGSTRDPSLSIRDASACALHYIPGLDPGSIFQQQRCGRMDPGSTPRSSGDTHYGAQE
jgi:hypothetical protein